METTKQVQLWGGLGFTALLIIFFMVAFFWKEKWEQGQWVIARILASLCAAFAATFFTGSALVDYTQTIGTGGKFAFQGAAGFALFFLIWRFFPKFEQPPPAPPRPISDGNVTLPSGTKFDFAVRLVADKGLDHARGVDFNGFTDAELKAPLLSDALVNLRDGRAALLRVRDFTGTAVGLYKVTLENDRYQVERMS